MMGLVYVGSSLHNTQRVRQIQQRLQDAGIRITYDWTIRGQIFDEETLAVVGEEEERGVRDCELFFMIHPARNGTHCELGMARALNKHIVILENGTFEKKTFYYRPHGHPNPIHRFTNEDEAITFVLQLFRSTP